MTNMNKKGTSGTEVIISFALFISFVMFIILYLNPLSAAPTSSLLSSLESSIKENTSITLEDRGFAIDEHLIGANDCFKINNIYPSTDPIFITDSNGNTAQFKKDGGSLIVKTSGKFYYLHKGIEGSSAITCASTINLVEDVSYSWSVGTKSTLYYSQSFANLKLIYDSNYAALKTAFRIPSTSDFSVIVMDENGAEIFTMTRNIPKVNVLSREFPIEILSSNPVKINKGYLRILVW